MTVIEILQSLKLEAERLLAPLDAGAARIYEISTTGALVERTVQMREFYQNLCRQLQRGIELLHR
ncbi:MAG TPA: hypothetical protein VHX52_02915 [Steroidobacteraceae bacterium]|jgi:hypothetical protein|nr:hypothetical protein [Steroidobacteraceae bacterium]